MKRAKANCSIQSVKLSQGDLCHEPEEIQPDFQGDEICRELLTLLDNRNADLNIRDLAARLLINRKEALLLLVTLESQGILTWDLKSRLYRPNSLKCDF